MENFSDILYYFGIQANNLQYEPITSGHINNTFKIYSGKSVYILQKVNTDIFSNPEQIMHNINIAQQALKSSYIGNNRSLHRFPEYIKAGSKNYCIYNGFWRIYPYIESTDIFPDVTSVFAFGKILGEFHKSTESVPISELYITLPDFHNIEKNIAKVLAVNEINSMRLKFYNEFIDLYKDIKNCFSPLRLVHNDIKWANILIDPETLLPDTLIDFDTVMPGYAAFDFGDGVRSACINENNEIDLNLLRAFSNGYFNQYKNINVNEAAAGILSVSAELSARYLYDALTDSGYFSGLSKNEKIAKHNNNLKIAEFTMNNLNTIKETISFSCG